MSEVTTIGLDIAKHAFHAHGADARGAMVFSRHSGAPPFPKTILLRESKLHAPRRKRVSICNAGCPLPDIAEIAQVSNS